MPSPDTGGEAIWTISALNSEVKMMLSRGMGTLWVEGEISNFARPASGHWYFTLKDANAQLKCAIFKNRNRSAKFTPEISTLATTDAPNCRWVW